MKDNEIRSYVFVFFGLFSYLIAYLNKELSFDNTGFFIFGLSSVICFIIGLISSLKSGG